MNPAFSRTFSSFRHPNFRWYFLGQTISAAGVWIQLTAQGYLVYDLTSSAAYLGYVGVANGIPSILLSFLGGAISDRIPRRTIILITQTARMILAFIFAGLTFAGQIQAWHIVLISFLIGIVKAIDVPSRQAFLIELVEPEDLANAIALRSLMISIALIIGPLLAGVIYAAFGPGWCFLINGITFLALIAALIPMQLANQTPDQNHANKLMHDVRDGIDYVRKEKAIRTLLVSLLIFSIAGFSITKLTPAWAVDVLKGDVRVNGLLDSARGIGSVVGSIAIAYLSSRRIKGKIWSFGSFLLPVILIIFSVFRVLPVSLLMINLFGISILALNNTTSAIIQTKVPDELRGRVVSIYTLMLQAGLNIGTLLIGFMADAISVPTTIQICGVTLLLFAIYLRFQHTEMVKLH